MSELLVTQCPHCQTRFRLTPEQLSVANGYVRCGACLEVFHAADAAAALNEQPAPQSAPARTETVTPPSMPQNQSSLLQDDLDDQVEPDLAALGLDESIISEVNPQTDPAADQSTPQTELHEDFLATPPAQDFGPEFDHNRTGLYRPIAENEGYSDKGIFQLDHPGSVTQLPPRQSATEEPSGEPDPAEEVTSAPAKPAAEDASEPPLYDADELRQEPSITPLRLEMLEEELLGETPTPRRPPSWLWSSLALLALLALPGQYLYYNFEALAHDQRSRPLLENLCLLARCELPARVDISRIRSTNLLVRAHPEFPNALAIDVILYNRADFEQPFPVLEMQFTDASGRQLASRRFRPEEYLSGELAGVRLMPSQTPIRVGLSMLDPGAQARNYQLEFLSP
ncbi:MAG: DUF3426 domain-containing protein [Pseudomonas sp.]